MRRLHEFFKRQIRRVFYHSIPYVRVGVNEAGGNYGIRGYLAFFDVPDYAIFYGEIAVYGFKIVTIDYGTLEGLLHGFLTTSYDICIFRRVWITHRKGRKVYITWKRIRLFRG